VIREKIPQENKISDFEKNGIYDKIEHAAFALQKWMDGVVISDRMRGTYEIISYIRLTHRKAIILL